MDCAFFQKACFCQSFLCSLERSAILDIWASSVAFLNLNEGEGGEEKAKKRGTHRRRTRFFPRSVIRVVRMCRYYYYHVAERKTTTARREFPLSLSFSLILSFFSPLAIFYSFVVVHFYARSRARNLCFFLPRVYFLLSSSDGRDLFRLLQPFLLKFLLPFPEDLRDILPSSFHFFFIGG